MFDKSYPKSCIYSKTCTYPKSCNHTQYGLTLIELLVVLSLVAIIATWGIPSFQAFGERNARSAAVNQLQSTLAFARNTAITQRMYVTVCPSDNDRKNCTKDWNRALLIVAGDRQKDLTKDEIIRIIPGIEQADIEYKRGWRRVRFDALGHSEGFNSRFYVCPNKATKGREVFLSSLGRVRVEEQPYDCSSS